MSIILLVYILRGGNMGLLVSLNCENCKYTIRLNIGSGLRDHNITTVLSYFSDKEQEQIKNEIDINHKRIHWDFRRMIAMCNDTGDIRSIPTFHTYANGEDILIAYSCDCGGDHTFISSNDLQEKNIFCECPKCGAKMIYSEDGFWD